MKRKIILGLVAALLLSIVFTGAGLAQGTSENFILQILHTNDHHSHLEGELYGLYMDGENIRMQLGGMSRIVSEINELRNENTIVLNSGELCGTLYFSLFKGEVDFKIFNMLKLDAYELGNHEFDEGEEQLAKLIEIAEFPIIGANVHPTKRSPLFKSDIKPYVIKEINGEKVGIIGVLKVVKTVESSMVSDAVEFSDEIETVKAMVKELQDMNINKIILLSHLGYDEDISLAKKVTGIDVIIGGDTHNLLDSTGELKSLNLNVTGEYPTLVGNPDGETVYIAQAWEYAHGLGIMNIKFDTEGRIISCKGRTELLVEGPFLTRDENKKWNEVPEEKTKKIIDIIDGLETVKIQVPDPATEKILKPYKKELESYKQVKIGRVTKTMPFDRIPEPFKKGETPTGSYAAYVIADAFLAYTYSADVTIQNAGGVRTALKDGDFTTADAYTALPFSNTIVTIKMSGADIQQVLEEGTHYSLTSGSTGAFPYASHLRYDVDKSAEQGSRILNLEVKDRKTKKWAPIDPNKIYKVVTNSFIALGKDGYYSFKRVQDVDKNVFEDTFVNYAVPLVEYFRNLPENTLPELNVDDYCLKSVK
ncbi:MAG: NAD nucleotidase [Caldisericota bacterium]|nr:NAD nucleotidase [Caldisericota bacterium]